MNDKQQPSRKLQLLQYGLILILIVLVLILILALTPATSLNYTNVMPSL